MPALPAGEMFESEEDYEIWDGEVVVKGQPSPWHEAIRVGIFVQLRNQLTQDLSVVASVAVEDGRSAPRADGAVVDPRAVPPAVLVWIEVISSADLRRGDERLLGGRRSQFLLGRGVQTIWAFTDTLGAVSLIVLRPGRDPEAFVSPATVQLTVRHGATEHPVTLDLGALAEAGRRAENG